MKQRRVIVVAGFFTALLLLAGGAAAAGSAAIVPQTDSSECLRSWDASPKGDEEPAWMAALSDVGSQSLAPRYFDFLECGYLAGGSARPSGLPEAFRSAAALSPSDGDMLLRFYRSCGGAGAGDPRLCKGLIKRDMAAYLGEDADWDALCAAWCDAFRKPDPQACARAVETFAAPQITNRDALRAACEQGSALAPQACEALSPVDSAACRERAASVVALRGANVRQCPAGSWRCRALVSADESSCRRAFFATLAAPACLGVSPGAALRTRSCVALHRTPYFLKRKPPA